MTNFSDAVNSTFRISDWFFKSFLDTNFQGAITANFCFFSAVLEFIRIPCLKITRDRMLKKFLAPTTSIGSIKKQKPSFQKEIYQRSLTAHTSCFFKKGKKTILWLCDDVMSSYFWFFLKLFNSSKVQPFGNLWWKVHPIWSRFDVVEEKCLLTQL